MHTNPMDAATALPEAPASADEYAILIDAPPLESADSDAPVEPALLSEDELALLSEAIAERLEAAEESPAPGTTAYVLARHRMWLESRGADGARADLTGASLRGEDLHGADLRDAVLRRTDLTGADLSLTDLRGANLAHADLRKANLLGAQLRDTGLQGATFDGAFGLVAGQLAGTNMFAATTDRYISMAHFEIMKLADQYSRVARVLYLALLASCGLSVLLVTRASDVQLIRKAPLVPLPFASGVLPADIFLLIGPLALVALYVAFHTFLLREWEQLAQLPQIFSDGFHVDRKGAWLLSSLIRPHCRWLAQDSLPHSPLTRLILVATVYWIVPATLLIFWARYLTRLHIHATLYHVGLIVATSMLALILPAYAARMFRTQHIEPVAVSVNGWRRFMTRSAVPAAVGALLVLISFGTVFGVPHDCDVSVASAADMRRWAPRALWLVGYDPFPEIADATISAKPANWNGLELAGVRGARLDGFSLRHAQAYRSFFVNAAMREAELDHADASESDFRGANLRHASLRFTDLSGARLNRAGMEGALLQNARLVRADLREANLSFAFLANAVLIDAWLANANLFSADLRGASLLGARVEKADLREADLGNARLDQADLRGAYLWSAKLTGAQLPDAQLQNAILIDADLRNAVLRGANLDGTVLRGANLEGADLRDTAGLLPSQLCGAVARNKALLDAPLRAAADEVCSATPTIPVPHRMAPSRP